MAAERRGRRSLREKTTSPFGQPLKWRLRRRAEGNLRAATWGRPYGDEITARVEANTLSGLWIEDSTICLKLAQRKRSDEGVAPYERRPPPFGQPLKWRLRRHAEGNLRAATWVYSVVR